MVSFASARGPSGRVNTSPYQEPPPDLVEVALEKLLSSATLQSSPRLRRFLEHVVSHSLTGDDDSLKEYTVGVDVFDRGARFDPRDDAIVRVEARRLREKLRTYYRTEGATDLVTISIPPGTYRPVFHLHEKPPAAILDDPNALCRQAESLVLRAMPETIARARHYLQLAIERWPARPELHAMLASATLSDVVMEFDVPSEGMPLVRDAACQALRLDPRRGDAYFYAAIPEISRSDKTAVLEGTHRALRLAPGDPVMHYWAATVSGAALSMGDMLTHIEMAVRLQPYSLFFQTWRAVCLFWAGQGDTAMRHLQDILAFEPRDFLANFWLGHIAAVSGHYDEAREAAARACDVSCTTKALAGLAWVEARAGRVDAAESILETLTDRARKEYVAHSRLAAIHVALGQLPLAEQSLQRAQRDGDWDLGFARGDARWTQVRGTLAGL
jgi:tetratricopeptide (TPR) repeat protein